MGTAGSEAPASLIFYSHFPPHYVVAGFPPLCPISIAKYYEMLRNFSQFLSAPATVGIPLPAASSLASRPFLPGSCPPVPTHPYASPGAKKRDDDDDDFCRDKCYHVLSTLIYFLL